MRRVAVTGLGVVTPVGVGTSDMWDALVAGKSGIGPLTAFDATGFPVRIAGECNGFDPAQFMDAKLVRRSDRFTHFALAAAAQAVAQAGWDDVPPYEAAKVGTIIGTGIGGLRTLTDSLETLRTRGAAKMSPMTIPLLMANAASGAVALRYGCAGINYAPVSACATGTHAIGEAARMIGLGAADAVLAGGSEATVEPLAMGAFAAMTALSRRNDEPQRASRPFDAERDGFILSEGAGVLVLEELAAAHARGATVLAEIIGYGATCDAFHMTQPDPEGQGATAAMRLALEDAGLAPSDVGYINAHGTSTPFNDKIESMAIHKVFDSPPPVSSTKSMTGHLLGAAGAVEAAVCVLALRSQTIPPTINYENPDPECELDVVPNTARKAAFDVTLSNSFGFGGHNACLAIRRSE